MGWVEGPDSWVLGWLKSARVGRYRQREINLEYSFHASQLELSVPLENACPVIWNIGEASHNTAGKNRYSYFFSCNYFHVSKRSS